jgi:hypothetical protein
MIYPIIWLYTPNESITKRNEFNTMNGLSFVNIDDINQAMVANVDKNISYICIPGIDLDIIANIKSATQTHFK